ncbi:MAG: hypothetical protein WKG07_27075 [Hymenobacter sp.]
MTHASIPAEQRRKSGLSDSLYSLLSVGIEDAEDRIEDLGPGHWVIRVYLTHELIADGHLLRNNTPGKSGHRASPWPCWSKIPSI